MKRNDLTLYERDAAHWWNPTSREFGSLHGMNRFRLRLLDRWIGSWSGRTVVDLGCGGGLLSEPLAGRGARVIGLDLSRGSLQAARQASGATPERRLFVKADLMQAPVADGCADLVLLADVLEHVQDVRAGVGEAARLAKPGGRVYVNTITRTLLSRLLAVTIAEGVGLVPAGTHDPALFVRPDELDSAARAAGLERVDFQAEAPAVWSTLRTRRLRMRATRFLTASYSVLYRKQPVSGRAPSGNGRALDSSRAC